LDFIEVARIVKPHVLVGELGVLMHRADSDALEKVERVRLAFADGSTKDLELARVRPSGGGYLVKFVGISDRSAAEALRNARVLVARALLETPEEGEAYFADLIGQIVVGPNQEEIGRIVDVVSYPSVDSLVIERPDGSRAEQPLVEDWVRPFDAENPKVVLLSLEGLLG
jgi:16S rRNA processing protein RimM